MEKNAFKIIQIVQRFKRLELCPVQRQGKGNTCLASLLLVFKESLVLDRFSYKVPHKRMKKWSGIFFSFFRKENGLINKEVLLFAVGKMQRQEMQSQIQKTRAD